MRNQLLTGYILHQKPYGETRSLIYLFSKELGMVHGIGKKNLPLFVPVQFFGNGKHSLKTLSQSQLLQHHFTLNGQSLFAGLYLNEILQKLLPIEEPLIPLWQAYETCLTVLARLFAEQNDPAKQNILLKGYLRRFENVLLNELGYGFDFDKDVLAQHIEPSQCYRYQLQQGFVPMLEMDEAETVITGEQLIAWQRCLQDDGFFVALVDEEFEFARALSNVMTAIYRSIIDSLLNYQTLQSRALWQQLTQYQ